jgi:hypothetical protein
MYFDALWFFIFGAEGPLGFIGSWQFFRFGGH